MTHTLATPRLALTYVPDVETLDWAGCGRCGVYYIACEEQAAGAVSLTSLSRTHGEIGYHIDPAFQGRGIATEAVEVVVSAVVQHHGFSLLTAQARLDNIPSRRVLEKTGFLRTGTKLCWGEAHEAPISVARYRRFLRAIAGATTLDCRSDPLS